MRSFAWAFLLVLATLILGCATTTEEVAKRTRIEKSEFDVGRKFTSPYYQQYPNISLHIRGWEDRNGNINHQLYITSFSHFSWPFIRSVSLVGGEIRKVVRIGSDVDCSISFCFHEETFGVPVTLEELEQHRKSGWRIRFNAQSGGDRVLNVPAHYIDGYLTAVYGN